MTFRPDPPVSYCHGRSNRPRRRSDSPPVIFENADQGAPLTYADRTTALHNIRRAIEDWATRRVCKMSSEELARAQRLTYAEQNDIWDLQAYRVFAALDRMRDAGYLGVAWVREYDNGLNFEGAAGCVILSAAGTVSSHT